MPQPGRDRRAVARRLDAPGQGTVDGELRRASQQMFPLAEPAGTAAGAECSSSSRAAGSPRPPARRSTRASATHVNSGRRSSRGGSRCHWLPCSSPTSGGAFPFPPQQLRRSTLSVTPELLGLRREVLQHRRALMMVVLSGKILGQVLVVKEDQRVVVRRHVTIFLQVVHRAYSSIPLASSSATVDSPRSVNEARLEDRQ